MSGAVRTERQRRAEDRKALEVEAQGERLLGGGRAGAAASSGGGEAGGGYGDLRGKMQALLVLAVSVWGLWEGKVIQGLLWSPRVNSTALALAVGSSSLVALLWGYLDIYVGHVKGQKVQYHDVRAVTHGILLGLLVAGFGLTAALWPVHKAASLVYVAMLSYGVLFQIILLVPASVYNPLFLAGYAAFVFYWTR